MRCDPPSEPSAHGTVSSMPSDGPPAEQQTVCDAWRGALLLPLSTGTRQRNWQWTQQVASCLPPWRSLVAASNTAVTGRRLAVLVGIAMEHGDRMSNLGFWSQLGTSTVIGHGGKEHRCAI